MKLVDNIEFKKLLSNLKIEETVSGGSVANSIVGLSQLGNKVGFIGKISDDELGSKYETGLKKKMSIFFIKKRKNFNWHMFNSHNSRLRANNGYFSRYRR